MVILIKNVYQCLLQVSEKPIRTYSGAIVTLAQSRKGKNFK